VHDAQGVEIGRLDLAYPPEKVGIELDSRKHHLTTAAFEHDRSRQNRLELAGWLILRYTWLHYTRTPQQLINDVAAALAARRT
jgi:very-short-patch-repair endonuclease